MSSASEISECSELQAAHDTSTLREVPDEATRSALNDLLVRIRLAA